jgi:hypothetical protein
VRCACIEVADKKVVLSGTRTDRTQHVLCVARADEDFEKWCVSLFEALDAAPEVLGAAAAGGGDQSLATYRATLLEGGVVCLSVVYPC